MNSTTTTPNTLLQRFALQEVDTPLGRVQYRHAFNTKASQPTHVLVHGIGSASASWVMQLHAAANAPVGTSHPTFSVLAWDAPGYGASTPVVPERPHAEDYATRLWAWLDALGGTQPVTLVGHSLGAIMVASAARMAPHRVNRLILLAPARGYLHAAPEERERKLHDRLNNLATLGPAGMAAKRGAAMLSSTATAVEVDFIQRVMAQINPTGYTQAAYLLANADVQGDLAHCPCPITVASGRADSITPEAACREVAASAGVPWVDLGNVGHACPLEAAQAVNQLLGLPTGDSL